MDHAIRQRLALHLRSEKALGLGMVPVRRRASSARAAPVVAERQIPPVRAVAQRPSGAAVAPAAHAKAVSPAKAGGSAAAEPIKAAGPAAAGAINAPGPMKAAGPAPTLSMAGPFTSPVLPAAEKQHLLKELHESQVEGCTRCVLCESRTNVVFGEGDVDAKVMFIGEGPGETEDRLARPFVGRAGQKLNEMIRAMGLSREEVYIANIVKCRPPGNRAPVPDEVAACTPFLVRQIELVRPKVIVTLGLPAMKFMLQTNVSMGRIRGQWHEWRGIRLMPTYHPAYILRNYTREVREAVWDDLKSVMAALGQPILSSSSSGDRR